MSSFKNDVFISYAHVDNTTMWVDQLRHRLRTRLKELGTSADIWKDGKLRGNDEFSDEILAQLSDSASLVSVITPSSHSSHWCHRERQKFEEFAMENGGFRVHNKVRAFKVVKTPVDGRADRHIFPGTLGYEFFVFDEATERLREFQPGTPEFEEKVNDLAQDIKALLDHLKTQLAVKPSNDKRIYLAEVVTGLAVRRKSLFDQLRDWGYEVVPDGPIEKDESYVNRIGEYLDNCLLSVHLVSDERGTIPGNESDPISVLQYKAALLRNLDRVVWIPPGVVPDKSAASAIDEGNSTGLEKVHGLDFEAFKDIVGTKLRRLLQQSEGASADSERRIIYLVCDSLDHPYVSGTQDPDQTLQLKNYLERLGFSVWLPPVSVLTKPKWRSDFRKSLRLSDAVVLFWGFASEEWFRETFQNFLSDRRRTNKPHMTQVIYLCRPECNEKRPYVGKQFPTISIEQFGQFQPGLLQPLVQRLQS
jgi:hypothetical protein